MPTSYKVITGDSFDSIARKQYGLEAEAGRIASANPGANEPLVPGTTLVIPSLPSSPKDSRSQIPASDPDEVAVLIEGQRFRYWDTIRLTRSVDAMDTVEYGAPFEPAQPGFKESFKPFSFKELVVTVGGEPLFTGTLVGVNPVIENTKRMISVSAYSLPGVLNDCTSPSSKYPLEFNNQGLRDIASSLSGPFGLKVEFQAEQGAIFEQVAIEPGEKILNFLSELARQRNLIVSSTPQGALVFWQSAEAGSPVAKLEEGSAPVLSVIPFFSPQEYYSHITGIEPVVVGLAGSQYTVKNPLLPGVMRPLTFTAQDAQDTDLKTAVEAKAGRMFANMVSYSIDVATWRDPQGKLWEPNTTITLLAPGAMVYQKYELMIRSIAFNRDSQSQTATLNVVIPGAFSGKVPEALPWDA